MKSLSIPLFERVVDGGFVSWVYGPTTEGWNAWNLEKRSFCNDLMVMDSPRSRRQEFWGEYKANRREDTDPFQEIRKANVREFRLRMLEDWRLNRVQVDGMEADDLVSVLAVYAQRPHPFRVIGVDKDYLQLDTDLEMTNLSGDPASLGKWRSHLQKAAQPWIKTPLDVLFTLALLGDQVDNIPRLIPPRRFDIFQEIMEPDRVGEKVARAWDHFKTDFSRNMYLAVLPGPWVFDPVPSPGDVLDRIVTGTYFQQTLHPQVQAKVLGAYYALYPFNVEVFGSIHNGT